MTAYEYCGIYVACVVCVVLCDAATNCNELQQAENGAVTSGRYSVTINNGDSITVYCQYYSGYGYTFISNTTNTDVNMTSLYDDTSQVIVRHKRANGYQYTAVLEQLSMYSSTPLLIQYNGHTGYQAHQNTNMTPYIYVGFIPESMTIRGATQGWTCNGQEYKFSNCDANPNSYIVFLFNRAGAGYTNYDGKYKSLLYPWYDDAWNVTSNEYLPDEFFTSFYEIHHGGCGRYAKGNVVSDIVGANVGVKFVITCAVPDDIMHGSKSYTGTSIGSTVTYSCNQGYTMVSGNSTTTCQSTGGWSGMEPVCRGEASSLTAVYISAAVVILAALAIAVVVIWWRRRLIAEPNTLNLAVCCKSSNNNESAANATANKAYTSYVADDKNTVASCNKRMSDSTDTGYVDIQCDSYEHLRMDTAGSEYNTIDIATSAKEASATDYAKLNTQTTPFADKTYSHLHRNPSNLQSGITHLDTTYSKMDNDAVSLNRGESTYEADDSYNKLHTLSVGNGTERQKDRDAVAEDDQYCHAVAGGHVNNYAADDYSHLHHRDAQQNIKHAQLMKADVKCVNDGYEEAVVGRTPLYVDVCPEDQTHIQDPNDHDYFILEKTGI